MKKINSKIKMDKRSICVTSIITTMTDEPVIVVSKSSSPEYDKVFYKSPDRTDSSSSSIEAFYSSRQDSFDTIIELQKKIISLKIESEKRKKCGCFV
jgi:hypothetical protein